MVDFRGHFDISKAFLEIDERFKSMNLFQPKTAYDMQVLSIFSQYMVVFIARTIEGSIKNIVYTKCSILHKSEAEMEEIVKKLDEFQNPNKEKIFTCFNEILSIELKADDFSEEQFTSLNQIVKDRHRIAHSDYDLKAVQAIKSLPDVEKHYNNIKEFISKICEIVSLN